MLINFTLPFLFIGNARLPRPLGTTINCHCIFPPSLAFSENTSCLSSGLVRVFFLDSFCLCSSFSPRRLQQFPVLLCRRRALWPMWKSQRTWRKSVCILPTALTVLAWLNSSISRANFESLDFCSTSVQKDVCRVASSRGTLDLKWQCAGYRFPWLSFGWLVRKQRFVVLYPWLLPS